MRELRETRGAAGAAGVGEGGGTIVACDGAVLERAVLVVDAAAVDRRAGAQWLPALEALEPVARQRVDVIGGAAVDVEAVDRRHRDAWQASGAFRGVDLQAGGACQRYVSLQCGAAASLSIKKV